MFSSAVRRRSNFSRALLNLSSRAQSTQVKGSSAAGPIGADGRHEIWREDIYDHDNEPK